MTISKTQYGNYEVYHPKGHLMFRCDLKKINWYLDRNLAEIIETNSEGKVISIRLNFKSNGSFFSHVHL